MFQRNYLPLSSLHSPALKMEVDIPTKVLSLSIKLFGTRSQEMVTIKFSRVFFI
jgi:hypothetical protein